MGPRLQEDSWIFTRSKGTRTIILVTGATGTVGAQVTHELVKSGEQVRVFVRDEELVRQKVPSEVDVALGDLTRPQTLEAALNGVDSVYLVLPLHPLLRQWDALVIESARKAGVRHVVKHSNLGAAEDGITLQRWHREGELLLENSDMTWTFVRPTGFMSNALGWAGMIKEQGVVYAPGGDGKLSVIDPRDIATVAATALTQPGHDSQIYEITGPEALSTADQVRIIGDAIGKPVGSVDIPDDMARAEMLKRGMPDVIADALLAFVNLVKDDRASQVTDTVERVTGRPARTFRAWAEENASAFQRQWTQASCGAGLGFRCGARGEGDGRWPRS